MPQSSQKTPDHNTPKAQVWLLYMPEAQTTNVYKKQVWSHRLKQNEKITKSSKSSVWWRSADTILFQIDWKISGIEIKDWTRSYSALPGRTARVTWLEMYDWKSCCHGNSIEAQSLLQCFGLVLDIQYIERKPEDCQRSKNREERKEENLNERWDKGAHLVVFKCSN